MKGLHRMDNSPLFYPFLGTVDILHLEPACLIKAYIITEIKKWKEINKNCCTQLSKKGFFVYKMCHMLFYYSICKYFENKNLMYSSEWKINEMWIHWLRNMSIWSKQKAATVGVEEPMQIQKCLSHKLAVLCQNLK